MTLCPKLSVFSVKISTVVKRGPGRTLVYYLFFKRCPLVVNILFTLLQKVPLTDAFIAAIYVKEIIIISYLL